MKNAAKCALSAGAMLGIASVVSAETLTWGNLQVEIGQSRISDVEGNSNSIFDRNPETMELSGAFGADWGPVGAQVDLTYGKTNSPPDEYTGFVNGNMAALHLNYDLSAVKVGAQYGEGTTRPGDDFTSDFDFYALESAGGVGNFMLAGQIGRFDSNDPDETDTFHDGKFLRLSGIYTLGESGAIEAEVAFFDGKQDNILNRYDMTARTWGVKYSRQFAAQPFAWSVGVDGGSFSNDSVMDHGAYDDTRVSLGLTTWFGDDTLAASKKRGILGQPDFARIVGAGNNVD